MVIVGFMISLRGSIWLVMSINRLVNGKTVDDGCGEEKCSSEEDGWGCHA